MDGLTITSLVRDASRFQEEDRLPFAATPWRPSSRVLWREGDSATPIVIEGETFEYFLEPFIIVEQFGDILANPDQEQVVERVIRYAIDDA